MSNLSKLEFLALDISGNNYLSWILDAEIHLDANGLGDTIKAGNQTTAQEKAKAMIFLRRHLHETLKTEYLTVKDPLVLWTSLKDRYDHQRTVILPKARYDWHHLRLQDYKSVSDYNSAMFRITSLLNLCGEKITDAEMLEKTFSTFHASNILLQQQYRERGFNRYCDLISVLLVAEQNNTLLMRNHDTRPTGTAPLSEANITTCDDQSDHGGNRSRGGDRGRGGYRGRGRGCGRGHGRGGGRGNGQRVHNGAKFKNTYKRGNNHTYDRGGKAKSGVSSTFHLCGMEDHWAVVRPNI